jgi:hypothetical protein
VLCCRSMRCDRAFKVQSAAVEYTASSGMLESSCCFQTDRKSGYGFMYNCCPEIMSRLYVLLYTHGQELIKVMAASCHLCRWWSDTLWVALTRLWPIACLICLVWFG